jgi:uncharacterized protein YlxP (DUF503 family)
MLPNNKQWLSMRAMLRRVMQDTVTIYNVTVSTNGEGYETKVRTLALTSIGQLSAANGSERQLIQALVDAGNENIETMKLTLPYGTSISVNQEVDTADSKVWNVVHTNTSQTYTAATEALLYRKVVNNTVID